VLGAANLDPDHWEDADRFDISRRAAGHLALGAGIHVCVGQNIARAEGQAVLRALAERVERIELTGEAIWRPNNAIHALDQLPLRLIPKTQG
jgi:cytochrome P450